ncbi:lysozyme inhibitor LprI family protein [Variovorax sp. VNK109]|uniref:lysozyme inhibitor LprI family protein n=1 Tax=Variovorax sp. VNK109 TaxID=3400919 RepID=UPI003BFC492B
MSQLIWQDVEKQFSSTVGADNAAQLMDITRKNLSIQLSGITTTETSKEVRQVSCQASMTTTVPETLKYDLTMFRTLVAKEGSGVQMQDRTLSGHVEYRVSQSDDRKTIRVEARGYSTFAGLVGGLGSVFYTQAMESRGQAARAAAVPAPEPAAKEDISDPREVAQVEYQMADKALNDAYQAARATMTDAQKVALRDEQRAWIKRRDEECSESRIEQDTNGDIAGGQAMQLEILSCKSKLTAERAKQLQGQG